jgi:hypothetical protein
MRLTEPPMACFDIDALPFFIALTPCSTKYTWTNFNYSSTKTSEHLTVP